MNRREFLQTTSVAALGSMVTSAFANGASNRKKKLLVLGGTHYLGPAIVQFLLDRGHEVTLFNRGKTNPMLFPKVERIRGDREPHAPDLSGLEDNRKWDVVIDVWPSDPHVVAGTARLLQDRTERYVFVSTIAAYKDLKKTGITEGDALYDDITDAAAWYEYDKAQCERVLQAIFGNRCSICRSHIINGYRNDSDSFRFWLVRIERGGDVLAPGDGDDPVQFTDVRDVGAFVGKLAEENLSGPYNVAGPTRERTTFKQFLEGLNAATGNKANLLWVSDDFLEENQIKYFRDLPMYIPVARAKKPGFMQIDITKALATGLKFRPLEATASDELQWFRETMPFDYEFGVGASNKGFPRARELRLISEWRARA